MTTFWTHFWTPGMTPPGPRGDPHPGYFKYMLRGLDVLQTSKNHYRGLWHAKMSNMYTFTRSSQKSNLGIKIMVFALNEVWTLF